MKLLKSRTFWTLVATFVFNGLQAIEPMVSVNLVVIIDAILLILASYFKLNPTQAYGSYKLANGKKKTK